VTGGDRLPVVVVDRVGWAFYRDLDGRPFLPAEDFEVRLVTGRDKLAEAVGDELAAVVAVPRTDHKAFADGARLLHKLGHRPVARIAAVTERYLLPVAELREELGLPGMTVAQTLRFRDKVVMKQHLSGKGIRLPDFAPYSPSEARRLLAKHGTVVAKPRLGAGSAEVSVLRSEADIEQFEQLRKGRFDEFDVEEFVAGRVFHVDSVVDRGRVIAATAGDAIDDNRSFETSTPFRDIGVPPGELLDQLLAFNASVIAVHPDFVGVTHHEMFASPDGVCFCEIAARAGGGGVLAGFRDRTGCNLDEAVLSSHLLERVPQQLEIAEHLTGFYMLYAGPGTVIAMPSAPGEDWVVETQLIAQPGDVLEAPADWGDVVAVVTVRGDTADQVKQRLDELIERMAAQLVVE
jgi:biotin carboxylase